MKHLLTPRPVLFRREIVKSKTNFLIQLQTQELLSLQQPLNKCLTLIDS